MDGSFTNTQRLIQWHHKAADPPGDCRSDIWFTYHLGRRLKALYAPSTLPRDAGFKALLWDYDRDTPPADSRIKNEPDTLKILKEINGYETATGAHLKSFAELKDDGSTTCASWIYCGAFPAAKAPGTPGKPGGTGLDAHSGADPFIMRPDGKGWLFTPAGLLDGPLPTHYEPAESPVANSLYKQQASPVLKY